MMGGMWRPRFNASHFSRARNRSYLPICLQHDTTRDFVGSVLVLIMAVFCRAALHLLRSFFASQTSRPKRVVSLLARLAAHSWCSSAHTTHTHTHT